VFARTDEVGIRRLFTAFLLVGATSFGGGVVAHLRTNLVARNKWVDDGTFVRLLAISQSLPGLTATNMSVLIGDELHGVAGAAAATLGLCLPGAALMFIVGLAYQIERERPLLQAALEGVAAAAVGLILATTVKLGRRSFARVDDLAFIVATVVLVNRLDISVPRALLIVGSLAAIWYGADIGRREPPA
jgi:chromate transporter